MSKQTTARPAFDRIMERVQLAAGPLASDCWLAGFALNDGYASVHVAATADSPKRRRKAHVVVYESLVGQVAAGLQLDHLCRVRHCVNPEHLEPVTPRENALRSAARNIILHLSNKCLAGHSLAGAYVYNGKRDCRVCRGLRARQRRLNDPEYREHRHVIERASYHRRKAAKADVVRRVAG